MSLDSILTSEQIRTTVLSRGLLKEIQDDGTLVVDVGGYGSETIECDLLVTGGNAELRLEAGDSVLFAPPESESGRGCVLGKIGSYSPVGQDSIANGVSTIHDRNIEITADSKLVLRCGEGSLTVREDGTVIIKGSRILSRSKGVNKIKGASVQLN